MQIVDDSCCTQVDIAFIVVTFNSEKFIWQCINSINSNFIDSGLSSSIIIVDNASSDNTRNILFDIEESIKNTQIILLNKNVGFGSANNIGFNAISAQYYVLINSDAWLIADSITPAVKAMRSNSSIAVCGLPLVFPNGEPQTYVYRFSSWQRWVLAILRVRTLIAKLLLTKAGKNLLSRLSFGREFVLSQSRPHITLDQASLLNYSGEVRQVDWVCGAGMVIAGDFIRNFHGFDPAIFLYGEDEDLCITAHRSGRKVVAADVPPVVHMFGWGVSMFNRHVADLKYTSLRYFIGKNIHRTPDRLLMLFLLPFYVYGIKRWYFAWRVGEDVS